jgi:hypothetical protein
MPVSKISDAPANIKELDGAKLTLSQINWILRVYDALKEQGKVKSPMAAAISQFKKSFKKDGDKWVKKEAAASASMVDLERLDRYHVVLTGSTTLEQIEDLRELEGDFGPGVYLLWSDEKQSVIAFAFEPALYSDAEAKEWVRQAMEAPVASATSIADAIVRAVSSTFDSWFGAAIRALSGSEPKEQSGEGLESFGEIRRLVDQAINDKYRPLGNEAWPWVVDIGTNGQAIVEIKNERYLISYTIDSDNNVTLGEPEPVAEAWVREDGSPVTLHAFDVHLENGDEADDGDDELVWKEIIHPGKWSKTDTGNIVEITAEMIAEVFRAWKDKLPKLISVPTDSHHDRTGGIVPVESNRGFVQKLKLIGDKLFGGFKLTDPEVSYGVQVGNIADCSVYLQPDVIHPETGEKYDWILEHVLLTNAPLVQDLQPFGVAPVGASADGQRYVQSYQQITEVDQMTQTQTQGQDTPPDAVTLSAADAAAYEAFKGLGLTADDVQAMVAERESVQQKARDLEITRVVRALEGIEEHDGVVQVEGFRHYPVVCAAVEQALRERPKALARSANEDGVTEVDSLILEIVNAIPQEGRLALQALDTAPAGRKRHEDPDLETGEEGEPTDDQITEFAGRLRPGRGSAVSTK